MLTWALQNITNDNNRTLYITEAAVKRLGELLHVENLNKASAQRLRVRIDGGGCSGFQYDFSFDNLENPDDMIFQHEDTQVIIDEASLEFIAGSQIDFAEDLMSAAFVIKNPNATASCGCGNSFSIF